MADAPSEIQTREPESASAAPALDPIEAAILAQDMAEAQHLGPPELSPVPLESPPEAAPPSPAEPSDMPADPVAANSPPIPVAEEEGEEDWAIAGITAPRGLAEGIPELKVPDQPVTVDSRYQVFPARHIPDLDSPSARAYEALDLQDPRAPIVALVPIPGMPIRQQEMDDILGHQIPGLLSLLDYGAAEWPHFAREVVILLFERPLGGRVVNVLKSDIPDFKKVDVVRALVDAMLTGLRQLNFRNLVHHAIRPDNLFFMDAERTKIVLGEFVTAPPSFDQPAAFETIERAVAAEAGRGVGLPSDDLYSFGATLAFLVQNGNPIRGMSKDELILAKMIHSSYQTLVGRHVLTARFLELMRGLLNDDPNQRWTYDAIDQWQNGRRVAPTQSVLSIRSQRPFRFGNVDHLHPRSLAFVMAQRRESAIRLIRDGTLETWITRGLEDKDLGASIRGRVEYAETQKNVEDIDELLLTRILLVLDPLSPINFKSLSFFPAGYGTLLAVEMMRDGDVRTVAEALQRDIPQIWYEAKPVGAYRNIIEETSFQRIRLNLQKTGPGYGLERILYEMNPSLACKSPLLGTAHVSEIEQLLPILNNAERTVDAKQKPFDRHLAAFIAARAENDVEALLDDFGNRDEAIAAMAVLRLYSQLQAKYGPEVLLGLARWIGGQVGPVIRLYHSRATRRNLENEIPSIVRRGSLPELLAVLDNRELRTTDQTGFASAVTEFQAAETEINEIHLTSRPSSDHVQRTARQVAAVISILFMICIVSVMIMAH